MLPIKYHYSVREIEEPAQLASVSTHIPLGPVNINAPLAYHLRHTVVTMLELYPESIKEQSMPCSTGHNILIDFFNERHNKACVQHGGAFKKVGVLSPTGAEPYSAEFACSHIACVGFLWVLRGSPTIKTCRNRLIFQSAPLTKGTG